MGFNLGNERIQDSYRQLVQISGSTLVNGTGSAIPAITNINSVSSSYAITASYADYAVSASYEIIHEVSSSYAETASFANFATAAASATTATSASHAVTASYAANASTPTLQQVTNEGASTSNNILMTNPNGNQTITITGSTTVVLRGAPDFITTFDNSGLFGVTGISTDRIVFDANSVDGSGANKSIDFINNRLEIKGDTTGVAIYGNGTDAATSTVFILGKNAQSARFKDASVELLQPVTASIISASSGFIGNLTGTATTASYISPTFISASAAASGFGSGGGTTPTLQQVTEVGNVTNLPITASAFSGNGSGLTNIPQVSQAAFFEADDYVFDLAGDTTSIYDIHVSQSGTYFLSASSTPAGVQGPRVNLYYWPELIAVGGTARIKFFVPNGDTLTGIQYKENITGSASNEWYWSSTTSPSATSARSITRNATLKQISIGTGVTTMTKDGNGRVFFVLSNANLNTTNYLYTGDSKNPLI